MPETNAVRVELRPITTGARTLLARAANRFDTPDNQLAAAARRVQWDGFAGGAEWMQLALQTIRGAPSSLAFSRPLFHLLGWIKYGLAGGAALGWLVIVLVLGQPLLGPLAVFVFYAVEVQMIFLFPLALDGSAEPFRDARRWTVEAGGTLAVMRVVLPLALFMLMGGFFGQGFRRSWCLGCLAVCLWYEDLRTHRLRGRNT